MADQRPTTRCPAVSGVMHAFTYRTIVTALRAAEGVPRFADMPQLERTAARVADALTALGFVVERPRP